MIQFDPKIASDGGYDYLVDFLGHTLRQAEEEKRPQGDLDSIRERLKRLRLEIEDAIDKAGAIETGARESRAVYESAGSSSNAADAQRLTSDLDRPAEV